MTTRDQLILVLVIVVLGLIFQAPYLKHYPLGHHSWTQTDHYALSLKFIENGFDFFHPETYTYPIEKIGDDIIPSNSTVTAVDFPIHQYIVAWIMRVTGDSSSLPFKIYTLLYSFLGLFFFGKIVFQLSHNFDKVLVSVILAATAPVFIYFQQSMMPTIPSWSNAIIGIYFWIRCSSENRKELLSLALLFLTLAALARTTYALLLIALFIATIIDHIQSKQNLSNAIIKFGISGSILFAYYAYNSYLRNEYGSIILSSFLPPTSFSEAIAWTQEIFSSWGFHYISIYHYPIIGFLLLAAFYLTLRKKVRLLPIQQKTILFAIIWITGCMIFALLMLQQFRNHDYYFLDSFFIPVFLFIAVSLSIIPFSSTRLFRISILFGLICWLIPVYISGHRHQSKLYFSDWWERTKKTERHFKDSDHALTKMGISEDAKILVIDAYSPNLPFIHLNRNGHPLVGTSRENLQPAMDWEWDYAIVQNEFFLSDVYRNYPEITQCLEWHAATEDLTIFMKDSTSTPKGLSEFLNLNSKKELLASEWTSTGHNTLDWYVPSTRIDSTGATITRDEYPCIGRIQNRFLTSDRDMRLFFSIKGEINAPNAKLVVTTENDKGSKYYRSYSPINFMQSGEKEWVIWTTVPSSANTDTDLMLLLFNPDKEDLKLKSAEFFLYTSQE